MAATTASLRGGGGGGDFLALWLVLVASLSLFQVSAMDIYTPQELSVVNGTDAKLLCTFASSDVISTAATVTWSFQAEGSNVSPLFFFYSNGKEYLGRNPQFKDRISWAGDLNKKDASITIANMQFHDNGTYMCDVKNPPDIDGIRGEIKLQVVEKGCLFYFMCQAHKIFFGVLEDFWKLSAKLR